MFDGLFGVCVWIKCISLRSNLYKSTSVFLSVHVYLCVR